MVADIVCEPNLSLPLTIGLYAKWGSGKSLLLPKIRESMRSFSRSWLDGLELHWSWNLVFTCLLVCTVLSLVIISLVAVVDTLGENYIFVLVAGVVTYVLLVGGYGLIYYGAEVC